MNCRGKPNRFIVAIKQLNLLQNLDRCYYAEAWGSRLYHFAQRLFRP
jgi:hypothetical protein